MKIYKYLAKILPGRLPQLYSTLDNPIAVPIQVAAYHLVESEYLFYGDRVIDVGFGIGYGLEIIAKKAEKVYGIEIDKKAVNFVRKQKLSNCKICDLRYYDGKRIPYPDKFFDVVVCVDVIEHVKNYLLLIIEMFRVSNRMVLISTPNRRPENTRKNGKPTNPWHLREWSFEEFDQILKMIPSTKVDWNFINGPLEGPYHTSKSIEANTVSLIPALFLEDNLLY
jgi:ubiquinone/menaquinone biosynthesis C-methylase UbiE